MSAGVSTVLISGGTGGNAICSAFSSSSCYHVLPVSDDGGSSAEIGRVFGGLAIGDIRSRLIRLSQSSPVKSLLAHRLSSSDDAKARQEWNEILRIDGKWWTGIEKDKADLLHGLLKNFDESVKRKYIETGARFMFVNGSIGNYVLSSAQMLFGSLPAAMFIFSSLIGALGKAKVLPSILEAPAGEADNGRVTIAAILENGDRIIGQCEISHPANTPEGFDSAAAAALLESQAPNNLYYTKQDNDGAYEALPYKIEHLEYVSLAEPEPMQIIPYPNSEYIKSLMTCEVLVYSCGSLWTSIIPSLALPGVSHAIQGSSTLKAKILLLNAVNDRETHGYSAIDYINAIATTLGVKNTQINRVITDLVYLSEGRVSVEPNAIEKLGVRCHVVENPRGNSAPVEKAPVRFKAGIIRDLVKHITHERKSAMGTHYT